MKRQLLLQTCLFIGILLANMQHAMAQIDVSSAIELNDAIANNAAGSIRLMNDITLSGSLEIPSGHFPEINLNGYKLQRNLDSSTEHGHVIWVKSGAELRLFDSSGDNSGKISGGRAYNGGGIYNEGTLNFQGGTITNCMASQRRGGAICNEANATVNMSGGVVLGCWGEDCGGIYNAAKGQLNISGGTISGNTSNAGGGGVVNYGTASITGGTIHNNHATTRGGGIWSSGTLTMENANIVGNRADIQGGGIYFKEGSISTLSGTRITNNTSADAGGIYVDGTATVSLTDCDITSNTSTEHGGGGVANHGTMSINGGTVQNNTCHTNGGGIWSGGTLNMQGYIVVVDNKKDGAWNNNVNNVYLPNGHVINVTGDLSGSSIGVNHQGWAGTVTSGLSYYGSPTNFFSDYPEIATLGLSGGEIDLSVPAGQVYYVERSWNSTNNQVQQEMKTKANGSYVELTGTTDNVDNLNPNVWYVVKGNVWRKGLNINGANVRLILCDGACLTLTSDAVNLEGSNSLTIYGQLEDSGSLFSNVETGNSSKWGNAGIGSRKNYPFGTLSIHGGHVQATGINGGAGIGSGGIQIGSGVQPLPHGSISIFGGNIEASGGYSYTSGGAGIGTGSDNSDYDVNITIYGGTINATGAANKTASEDAMGGAGIGGGSGSKTGMITVYGGNITATGGEGGESWWNHRGGGAGIGSGAGGYVCYFTMYAGTVRATGKESAAGIGGSLNCSGGKVTIRGGTVYAYGGTDAAGIGSGEEQVLAGNYDGGTIEITGGYVYAEGNDEGAGIGAGLRAAAGDIRISGGTVEAHGGENSMAICSHDSSDGMNAFYLGDGMMVTAEREFAHNERYDAIQSRKDVFVKPCPHTGNHLGSATYTNTGNKNNHSVSCPYCLTTSLAHQLDGDLHCGKCDYTRACTLDDNANNAATISEWNNYATNVTLSGRTLYKDGKWNTLCLPFDVTLDESPLAGAEVRTLVYAYISLGTLNMHFSEPVSELVAGKPCLIKWEKASDYVDDDAHNIVSPVFSNVTVSAYTRNYSGTDVSFKGTYDKMTFAEDNQNILFVGSGNTLYWPKSGASIKACRAYFEVTDGNTAHDFVFNFDDGTPTIIGHTGITEITEKTSAWYDLQGRKVANSQKPKAKGLYIVNGKKMMIK